MPAIGKRIKMRYRGENIYVSIFPDKKELFVSMVEKDPDKQGLTLAGLDTISRLASRLWQTSGIQEVLKQLERSSRSTGDFPGILYMLLTDHGE